MTQYILDNKHPNPDTCCMLLANITREPAAGTRLLTPRPHVGDGSSSGSDVDARPDILRLIDVYCRGKAYNSNGVFDYLGNVIFNVTQIDQGRALFLKESSSGLIIRGY